MINHKLKWTYEEKEYLAINWKQKLLPDLCTDLGRTEQSLINMARKLNLGSRKRSNGITENDINTIKQNADTLTAKEISRLINKTPSSVWQIAQKNNISLKKIRRKSAYATKSERQEIIDMYENKFLNCSEIQRAKPHLSYSFIYRLLISLDK